MNVLAFDRNVQRKESKMFANVSAGADKHSGAAAHFRLVIIVLLRMAASAVAASALMPLLPRLRARGRMETVRE